jgi:hypothetical protein
MENLWILPMATFLCRGFVEKKDIGPQLVIQNLFCLQSKYSGFFLKKKKKSCGQILGFANECIYVKLKIMVVLVICRIGLVKVFLVVSFRLLYLSWWGCIDC